MVHTSAQFAGVFTPQLVGSHDEQSVLQWIAPEAMPAAQVTGDVPAISAAIPIVYKNSATGICIRCDKQGGTLEIVDPRMFRPGREMFCEALRASAFRVSEASAVDLDIPAHLCRFHFEAGRHDEAELSRRVSLAIEAATRAQAAGSRDGRPAASTDCDRRYCLALGGGSLMAGVAGLMLPGVPSAPFLLFSAYYFVQSSTTFERWLDQMPCVADIVRKFEASGAPLLNKASLAKTVVMVILLGLLFFVFHPPFPLIFAIELAMALFYSVGEIDDLGPFCRLIPKVLA